MKMFLTNQQAHLIHLLPAFKTRPLAYDTQTVLQEKATSMVVLGGAAVADLSSYNFDSLFAYDIFPGHILSFAAEWQYRGEPCKRAT
jgi:hypothetical protein